MEAIEVARAGRPKKPDGAVPTTSLRIPPDLLAEVDAERERIEAERPGMTVTRADAIRVLLVEALTARKAKRSRK